MKSGWYGTILLLMLLETALASTWVNSIKDVVPSTITVTEITETTDFVNIVGRAKTNDAISALMRAIDQARLGSPQLQQVKRTDGISVFVLRVQAPR